MNLSSENLLADSKFEVTKKNGQSRFYLKTETGQVILVGDAAYITRYGCMNGINSVKYNCLMDNRFECKVSATGKFYFSLRASNGQLLGVSEMYDTIDKVYFIMELVKETASEARIIQFD